MDIFKKKNLINNINTILCKHGINEQIILGDIIVTRLTVIDTRDAKLSNAIINHLWPNIKIQSFYHFTTKEAAESILNNKTFRLTNIAKRFDGGEIKKFCEDHCLQGYLKKSSNGDPVYKNLIMPNTYYASFTDTSISTEQEQNLWNSFAKGNNGVRLKFNITIDESKIDLNFKKIIYEAQKKKPIPLLIELRNTIKNNYDREFTFWKVSTLCCFYLPNIYTNQNEYRMLYKIWEKPSLPLKESEYIELPLGCMSEIGSKLEITEVCAFEKPDVPDSYHFIKRK